MKRIQFIDRMAQGKMSRRQMLSSAGAFGVGLLSLPKLSAAAEVLTCMEWGGYDAAEYFKPYVDKHGGAPNFSIFSGEEDALGQGARRLCRRCDAPLQLFRRPLCERQARGGNRYVETFQLEGCISRLCKRQTGWLWTARS